MADIPELEERILRATYEYGPVPCDMETADNMFHATWEDFMHAIGAIISHHNCKLTTYLEEDLG